MMKKLISLLICLALLPALCLAEETATLPGRRIVADDITISIGEESFAPGMSALIEHAASAECEYLSFCVENAGSQLLPIQARLDRNGTSVMLDDSAVYCFAPELLAALTGGDASAAAELLGAQAKSLPELAFGFAEFLDAQPADEFLLDMPLLIDWLATELEVDEGALSAISNLQLPEITIRRETAKYSISAGGETPMLFSLTRDDRLVSLKNSDTDFRIGAQVYRDGNIQMSFLTGEAYINRTDKNLLVKYSYAPTDDGAKFSMTLDYDDTWMYYDWGRTFLYADGTTRADGTTNANIRFTSDPGLLFTIPVGAQFTLHSVPADVADRMAGKPVQIIRDYNDDAMNRFTLAAMALMGDAEKLISDPEIQKIFDARDALYFEYYGLSTETTTQ